MSIYGIERIGAEVQWKDQSGLWEALDLDVESVKIISITGAGGKTSVMFRLAEELKTMGKRVVVTTSTHIYYPDEYQVEIVKDASELKTVVWRDQILVVGSRMIEVPRPTGEEKGITEHGTGSGTEHGTGSGTEHGTGYGTEHGTSSGTEHGIGCGSTFQKLAGLDPSWIAGLASWCDVVLIEADGSRRLPLKAPAAHEPVIIPETDMVIGCMGLTCIGKPWKEACFRPELAVTLLQEAGYEPGTTIRPEDAAHILLDRNGTRKQVENRPYRIVLNQADEESNLQSAWQIEQEIRRLSAIPVIITSNLLG